MADEVPDTVATYRRSLRTRRWQVVALVVSVTFGVFLVMQPRTAQVANGAPLAPDFTLPAVNNHDLPITLHSFKGHPVLLNFFNSACPPCLDELPTLRQTAQAYRSKGVVVVGVATGGDTIATASGLAMAAHLAFPVLVDVHQTVAWQYQVGAWPTSIFLDGHGRMQALYVGPLDRQTTQAGLAQAGAINCASCEQLTRPPLDGADSVASNTVLSADVIYNPARPAPAFSLRDQHGRRIGPASFRGKVLALTFVSAACREQCPLVGQALAAARALLGEHGGRLVIMAVSVDPEQDSQRTIRDFAYRAGWQNGEWHYLSASRAALSRVWGAYGVFVPAPAPIFRQGATIVHQAQLFLIDPQGRLRAYYDVPFLAARAASTVRALLAESGT